MQLDGKKAIVTGGGRGIGRGIVERFLAEGAAVAVMQRSPLEEPLAKHPDVTGIEADLSDPAVLPEAVDQAAQQLGGVDVLVNNAGVMFERELEELEPAEWQLMAALNLQAPLFLAQAVLPYMRRRGGGAIISVGSVEGFSANPSHAAYSATKAGIHGMTRALAVDLGADGIRCTAIAPGWIDSDLSEAYLDSHPDPPAARAALVGMHPVGRTGRPADVGDLAVFLAGDGAQFLSGETIVLDGGRTSRLPTPF